MPHARGAIVAMAGLIGSMMVSYTKARAESIGVRCTVGMMERPERMICLLADALARVDDLAGARAAALSVAEKSPTSRLAPRALLEAATLDLRAGQDAAAEAVLVRLVDTYSDAAELPAALYLLGLSAETRGQLDAAAQAYREIGIRAPPSGYADGAEDPIVALETLGVRLPSLTPAQRADRAERLLRDDVPDTAMSEAERLVDEVKVGPIATRALRVIADG